MSCLKWVLIVANRNCLAEKAVNKTLANYTTLLMFLQCLKKNKKFELMLTRRAKVYSSSCSQIQTVKTISSHFDDFYGGTANWSPRAQVSLNLESRDLDYQNLRLMLKISYAGCPCLSHYWFRRNSLLKCLAARNCQKKSAKPPILAFKFIEGHWIWWQSRASVRLPISD